MPQGAAHDLRAAQLRGHQSLPRHRDQGDRQGPRAARRSGSPRRAGSTSSGPAGSRASAKRQLRATKFMFKVAKRYPRIKRLYVYTWFGATTPRFDAGLVAHGRPRPAYGEVQAVAVAPADVNGGWVGGGFEVLVAGVCGVGADCATRTPHTRPRGEPPRHTRTLSSPAQFEVQPAAAARSTASGSSLSSRIRTVARAGSSPESRRSTQTRGRPSSARGDDVVEPRLRGVDPAAPVALGALA